MIENFTSPPAGTPVSASNFARLVAAVGVVCALTFLPQAAEAQTTTPTTVARGTMFAVEQVAGTGDVKVSWDWEQGTELPATTFQVLIHNEARSNCTRTNVDLTPDSGTSYSVSFDATVRAPSHRTRSSCQGVISGDDLNGAPLVNSFDVGTKYIFRMRVLSFNTAGTEVIASSQLATPDSQEVTITTPTMPTADTPAIVLTTDTTTYAEAPSAKIVVTATATPAPTADLTVNVRVEGGGIARFFAASGDAAHNKIITITGGETTGTVDYNIHNDAIQEADTDDQVMALVREPVPAGAYSFSNSDAPTLMVTNDDQQSGSPVLTSVTAGDTEITVAWDAPSEIGSSALRNYSICIADTEQKVRRNDCAAESKATFEFSEDEGTDTADTSYEYTLTGLTNGTAYYVGVAARNGVSRGQGNVLLGVSMYAVHEEPAGTAVPVTPLRPAPTDVTATAGDAQIEVTWTNLDPAPPAYVVCHVEQTATVTTAALAEAECDIFTVSGTGEARLTSGTTPHTLAASDLADADTNGKSYYIFAQANYGTSRSAWVAPTPNPVTPMAPASTDASLTDLTVTGITLNEVFAPDTFDYTADVAATVTTFTLAATPATGATVAVSAVGGTGATVTADSAANTYNIALTDGATSIALDITVTAESVVDEGFYTLTITRAAPAVTNPPASVTATAGDREIVVTWTAPSGGTPDSYDVCFALDAGFTDFAAECGTINTRSVTSGLTTTLTAVNRSAYRVGVRAVYGTAQSTWLPSTPATVVPFAADDNTFLALAFYEGADTSGTEITPTPAFTAGAMVMEYALAVAAGVTDVTIAYTTTNPTATVEDDEGNTLTSTSGSGTFTANLGALATATPQLTVTPPSGAADEATYTFSITRAAPAVTTLSALATYEGATATGTPLTLMPAFSATSGQEADEVTYVTEVTADATQATLAFTPTDSTAEVRDSYGGLLTSPQTFDLNIGIATTFHFEVRPQGGVLGDGKNFLIRFNRATATTPTPGVPTLTIAAVSAAVTEGTDAAVSFTVTSTPAPTADLAVTVALTGGDAFVAASERTQTITIAADAPSAVVNFPIDDDAVDDADASVVATIGFSDAYEGDGNSATATIADDDEPLVGAPDAFSFDAPTGVIEPGTAVTSNAISVSGLGDGTSAPLTVTGGTVSIGNAGVNNANGVTSAMVANSNTVTVTATSGACGERVTATVTIGGVDGDFVVTTRACSTDASLSALMIYHMSLTPTFAADTLAYTAEVTSDVAATTIMATANDPNASVEIPRADDSGEITLSGGANNIAITVTAEDGTTTQTYTVTIQRDRLPSASASAAVTALATQGVTTLTGTGTDPDGDNAATAYMWAIEPPTDAGTLSADDIASPTYTAPHVAEGADARTITLTLTVTFADADTATASVTLTVMPDRPPVAVARADVTRVAPDGTVQLNAAGSADPDDRPGFTNPALSYAWSVAPNVGTLSDATSATPTYTAPPPAELVGVAPALTFTLTVTFTDGDPATDELAIAIISVDADAVMEVSVVSVGAIDRSVATQSIGLIAQRFTAPAARAPSTGGGQQRNQLARDDLHTDDLHADDLRAENLAHTAPAPGSLEARYSDDQNWQRLRTRDINLRTLLEKNPVAFNLGDSALGAGDLGVWLAASHSEISGTPGGSNYDGHADTVQAGADHAFNDGALLLGLALGWNTSDMDFTQTDVGGGATTRGEISRSGISVHPYLSWRTSSNASAWLLGGYGLGDHKVQVRDGGSGTSDATQWLLAGGIESAVSERRHLEVIGRIGGFFSHSEVDSVYLIASGTTLPSFDSSSWQVQGEAEVSRESDISRCVRQYLLGGARVLGGDDLKTAAGFSLGGGIKGDFIAVGLSFDVGARFAATETDDLQESMLYGAVRYDAGGDGRGFVASFEQGMSQVLKSNWRTGVFDDGGVRELDAAQGMQATVGYGWGARLGGHVGVLTAFGEMAAMEQALGLRFDAAGFGVRLETREREVERRTELRVERKF